MLNKNKNSRYCNRDQVSSHIWFKDFNWEELISLKMSPAYLPKIESNESKYTPKVYLDYINSLKDWENTENQPKPSDKQTKAFEEWLKKF